jgi:Ras-related protein Rab-6A
MVKKDQNPVKNYQITFIGDQAVGKTNILKRWVYGSFDESSTLGIPMDLLVKIVNIANKKIRLQIWDTPGPEIFIRSWRYHIKDSSLAVIVLDTTNRQSLENCDKWVKLAMTQNRKLEIILVGNKIDDFKRRAWTFDEAHAKAFNFNLAYIEVSASTGYNIGQLFTYIINILQIYKILLNMLVLNSRLSQNSRKKM